MPQFGRLVLVFLVLLVSAVSGAQEAGGVKDRRTPAQRKIDSQLLQEIERQRGIGAREQTPITRIQLDRKKRALVDIRVDVTPAFQKKLTRLGAAVVSTSVEYRSIIAWVPLLKLEQLAADKAVRAINPAPEPAIHREPVKTPAIR